MVEVGTKLSGFTFLKEIGSGAFASVWRAVHDATQTVVAIKVITKESIVAPDAKTRFNREIALLRELKHPFIAELYEILEDEKNHYLIMEFAENGNMLEFVNNTGRITEAQARRYFSQLIYVLEYLHQEKKIAHRDLKAENIMLDSYGNIRVIDFGLSNVFLEDRPQLETACGSPAYAAPEMIRGNPYTKAADIWSSGILLYSMVAGQLPYDDDNVQQLLQKIVYTDVRYPGFMSPALVDLLRKMLTKNPDNRITIDRIKDHYWFSQAEYEILTGERMKQALSSQKGVDREILDRMVALGIDTKQVTEQILRNEFTPGTAVYRMLSRQKVSQTVNEIVKQMRTRDQPRVMKLDIPANRPPEEAKQAFPKTTKRKVMIPVPGSGRDSPKVLATPAPVQIAARRLSRPVAVRRTIAPKPIGAGSRETPV